MARTGGTIDVDGAAPGGRSLRLSIPTITWLVLLAGFVAVVAVSGIVSRAQRPLGWALAAIVLAAALHPAVAVLDRRMPRPIAVLAVILAASAIVGGIAFLTLRDLDDQFDRLRAAIPEAAAEIEASPRFGDTAKDFGLLDKAQEFADDLRSPSRTVGRDAAPFAGGAFLVLVLTLFMLAWGRRMFRAAAGEIDDPARRARLSRVVERAFRDSQHYVNVTVVGALIVFGVAFATYSLIDLPGAAPLALLAALASTVPVVGLLSGVVPAVALEAGLVSPWAAALLLAGAVAAQFAQQHALDRCTRGIIARPGSAVMLIFFVFGYDLYGAGGALVGTALVVFAVALVDSFDEDRHAAEPG